MPLVRLIIYMPESRTEPILKVLIEKIYEKNKAVYLLNSELYIEYNHYIVSYSFSELSSRHFFRLYRLDGSKWPGHWRHVRVGPFERTVDLLKLALPGTKPFVQKRSAGKGLHRHFEGRCLEWPTVLLSKLGHLRKNILNTTVMKLKNGFQISTNFDINKKDNYLLTMYVFLNSSQIYF